MSDTTSTPPDSPLMTPPSTPTPTTSAATSTGNPSPPSSPPPPLSAYPFEVTPHPPASTARSEAGSSSFRHDDFSAVAIEEAEERTGGGGTLTVYKQPTALSILRGALINLALPFINGLMLGFGELFAHEIAFRFGWGGTRVFPTWRSTSGRPLGPGVAVRERGDKSLEKELEHTASPE